MSKSHSFLVDTNKRLFKIESDEEYRKIFDMIILNNTFSLMYCMDINFNNRLNKLNCKFGITLSCLKEALHLYNYSSVVSLELYDSPKIFNLDNFSSLNNLKLKNCKNINDVGYLRKLKTLTTNGKMNGIHLLRNLKVLAIRKDFLNKKEIKKMRRTNQNFSVQHPVTL
jgi:hypothetical protein